MLGDVEPLAVGVDHQLEQVAQRGQQLIARSAAELRDACAQRVALGLEVGDGDANTLSSRRVSLGLLSDMGPPLEIEAACPNGGTRE